MRRRGWVAPLALVWLACVVAGQRGVADGPQAREEHTGAQPVGGERVGEPFRYPEGKHGKGELRYINGLPVLVVAGSPEEIGEQYAVLALEPARGIMEYPKELLRGRGLEAKWALLTAMGRAMLARFPEDHRTELEAIARFSAVDRDVLIAVNTIDDIARLARCSSLIAEGERSATGGPLFGRNLDYEALGWVHEYGLVVVYRPEGKHGFASVGFPGLIGCASGMNDAGLAIATHDVSSTGDGAPAFDPRGVPILLTFRRIMEECATVRQAEELLRSAKLTTLMNLAACDREEAVVFELTPRNVVVRRAEDGMLACTNDFRTKELATAGRCWRYERLEQYMARDKVGLADVKEAMHAVNQGDDTLQTMIFEPEGLKLHVAIGSCPSSALPLKELALETLFE